ncbi:MAG TPA: D-glycerate dehydrogenase [Chloroflexi bacterium]|nr:D-glycerate dehydrogenase [Chloroflexota bacterium]
MKVLASRRFPGPAWDELREVEYLAGPLKESYPGVEVLAGVGQGVDDAVLERFPDLRLVANYGVGYDVIDVAACERRGVAVTNTPGVLDAATAELAVALILAVRRRIVEGDRFVREGNWSHGWAELYLVGEELAGSTLGIVGLGRIGRAVAARAKSFELRILYAQRHEAEDAATLGAERRELDELLREADIVTLHVPLTDETRELIDARRLALLRDGACLVNTSRGAIVEEQALVAELVSARIRAGLDVYADEPNVPRELLDLPNVVLTPHVGSATVGTREAMTRVLVDNILALQRGEPLPNQVA